MCLQQVFDVIQHSSRGLLPLVLNKRVASGYDDRLDQCKTKGGTNRLTGENNYCGAPVFPPKTDETGESVPPLQDTMKWILEQILLVPPPSNCAHVGRTVDLDHLPHNDITTLWIRNLRGVGRTPFVDVNLRGLANNLAISLLEISGVRRCFECSMVELCSRRQWRNLRGKMSG